MAKKAGLYLKEITESQAAAQLATTKAVAKGTQEEPTSTVIRISEIVENQIVAAEILILSAYPRAKRW